MKKKSLLFLSICAWALQSHLVQADTLVKELNTVSKESESSGQTVILDSSNTLPDNAIKISEVTTASDENVVDTGNQLQANQSIENRRNDIIESITTRKSVVDESGTVNEIDSDNSIVGTSSVIDVNITDEKMSTQVDKNTEVSPESQRNTNNTLVTSSTGSEIVMKSSVNTTVSKKSTESMVEVNTSKEPNGTITIENRNDVTGTFDVRVTNIVSPKEVASVLLPTWSQVGGYDDLRWYEATRQTDGSYKLTVNKKDHKYRTGNYVVHLYYKDSTGGLTGAGGTTTHLSEVKPSGTITIENRNDVTGTFDVRVTNIVSPKDVASVLLPTWSQVGGYDDLRWYEATRQTDGSYKLTV
ncbi:TPA: GBS Bsp-like repeat-containing protein, partial [Streptococcus suis]